MTTEIPNESQYTTQDTPADGDNGSPVLPPELPSEQSTDQPNEPAIDQLTDDLDFEVPVAGQRRRGLGAIFQPSNLLIAVVLIVIMGIGAYYRFVGQNWDDYTHLHPDERFLTQVTTSIANPVDAIDARTVALNVTEQNPADAEAHRQECLSRYPNTKGVGDFFDSLCSNWNPKNTGNGLYVYGELPLFIVKIAGQMTTELALQSVDQRQRAANLAAQAQGEPAVAALKAQIFQDRSVAQSWSSYEGVHLIGRSVAAVAELLSIVFVFLIGRRLYNKWVGLLAAMLAAAAVFPIQLSHFWTTDAFTELPVVITMWFSVRAMDRGRWYDFVGAGIAMGAAIASRINVLPFFGIIGLAALIYAVPALDIAIARSERWRLIRRAFFGIVLGFVFTFITFRIANPHAFVGGPGIGGFFHVFEPFYQACPPVDASTPRHYSPNIVNCGKLNLIPLYQPFKDDVGQSQYLTSGNADIPPNHQWASRIPYLFPGWNMIMWGMGLPLGLMAWFAWGWALLQIFRARPLWTRHALPVVWILVYFGYMGRLWVATMRYYLPLYPFLIILAAWALYEIVTRAWYAARRHPTTTRRLVGGLAVGLLVVVVGYTYLWATMFTSIYRRELSRVEASQWLLRNAPAAFAANITMPNGEARLLNLPLSAQVNITSYNPNQPNVTGFIAPNTPAATDRIVVNHLTDPDHSGQTKNFWAGIAMDEAGSQIVAQGKVSGDFGTGGPFGSAYMVMLDKPLVITPANKYFLVTWADTRLAVTRRDVESAEFMVSDSNNTPVTLVKLAAAQTPENQQTTAIFGDSPAEYDFTTPIDGTIKQITVAHIFNPLQPGQAGSLSVQVADKDNNILATGTVVIPANATKTSPLGDQQVVQLDKPIEIKKDQAFKLLASAKDGGPFQASGTVIATEGPWDDDIPYKVCELPLDIDLTHAVPSGLYNVATCKGIDPWGYWYKGVQLYMSAEDDAQKQNSIETALNQADYLTISSNRFYDSLSRIPTRFPMSINYYNALFAGKLGYDLVKVVTSYASIGNFEIADLNLPIYNTPKWVKELQSEEAFSVYDHPAVFIFKRNPNYNPKVLQNVLAGTNTTDTSHIAPAGTDDASLINVIRWGALPATSAPTAFMMQSDLRDIQAQGGTWSDLFNRNWTINTSPVLAVVVWWLVIMLLGFIVWPLLFVLLPGLPDRGYPFAKIVGLLLVAWIVWAGGALRFLTWSAPGILITAILLAVISILVARRNRQELMAYLRANWRHFVIIEVITLMLFAAFLFVRLGNPDLWAQTLGGEKPMDFAYFNAVLRSTVFPPYDPWYAGGYLNYYYFGFVLVGVPVKLLGIMPEIGYNLIVPTLFALTGIGAFSVAFNVVASRWFFPRDEGQDRPDAPLKSRRRFALRVPQGSPYIAGIMALLLCVVLGNLDTPRVFLSGVSRAGGCAADADFYSWKVSQYMLDHGSQPPPEDVTAQLSAEAAHPTIGDQFAFAAYTAQHTLGCFSAGIGQIFQGGAFPLSPDRWYWMPTRVVGEIPGNSNEINEMPWFTYVFGDLHAHMIAMPLTLLAIGWLLGELLIAGTRRRSRWTVLFGTLLGGLAVGVLRATNTWDWITYSILSIVGLLFAATLFDQWRTRRHLVGRLGQIAWFILVQLVAVLPFTAFFGTAYNAIKAFEGNKTPIWAYTDIHGVFLFAVGSLLIWQTARLLRNVYVRDFTRRRWWLLIILAVIVLTVIITLVFFILPMKISLAVLPIPIAIICLPLIAWCVILFLMPDQSREMAFLYMLTALAIGISFGVEIVVLDGDIGRQNTFFKFYMQAWILLSVVSGVAFAWLFHASERWRGFIRLPWLAITAVLLSIAALFPVMSTEGKSAMRMAPQAPHTLDGLAYMKDAVYYSGPTAMPLADDLKMIQWLQDNVKGSPVILEARHYGSEYTLDDRISIATGLPTIIGWSFHQQQQRTFDPLPNLVVQRGNNVQALYNTVDVQTAWTMIKFFHIEYIIVGKLEESYYQPGGLAKFDQMVKMGLLKVDYEGRSYDENAPDKIDPNVEIQTHYYNRIYHIVPGANLPDQQAGDVSPAVSPVTAFNGVTANVAELKTTLH